MNPLVYHLVSGQALFTGIVLLLFAGGLREMRSQRISRWCFVVAIIGLILIALSSAAVPLWLYGIAGLVTLLWLCSGYWLRQRRKWTVAMMVGWGVVAGWELAYWPMPQLEQLTMQEVLILGDSLTAGDAGNETVQTWPQILEARHGWQVHDLSHVGETAGSALQRLQTFERAVPFVLIEIGGNDLLGQTTPTQFARDLEALLSAVSGPQRQVLMFELPLPPGYYRFGRIQRILAGKYGVQLIPKRILLDVLAPDMSTTDSIHLTQQGHEVMAEKIATLINLSAPVE